MDALPKGLQNILQQVILNNRLTSWRVYGETSIVVTLRFSDTLDSYTQYTTPGNNHIHNQSYRSKPPSAVARDTIKLSEYNLYP
jgi:hypothetical protein